MAFRDMQRKSLIDAFFRKQWTANHFSDPVLVRIERIFR